MVPSENTGASLVMRLFKRRYSPIFIEENYYERRRKGGLLMKLLFLAITFSIVISVLYLFLQ
jgi:hypothetical protein